MNQERIQTSVYNSSSFLFCFSFFPSPLSSSHYLNERYFIKYKSIQTSILHRKWLIPQQLPINQLEEELPATVGCKSSQKVSAKEKGTRKFKPGMLDPIKSTFTVNMANNVMKVIKTNSCLASPHTTI